MEWVQGILPHEVKQPGREIDQLLPSSAEIDNIHPFIL
jgi:hypothetical protein